MTKQYLAGTGNGFLFCRYQQPYGRTCFYSGTSSWNKIPADYVDARILRILHLHEEAEVRLAEIAKCTRLMRTPCWRRIQRLKQAGAIRRQVVLAMSGS